MSPKSIWQRASKRLRYEVRAELARRRYLSTQLVPTRYGGLSAPSWSPAVAGMALDLWEPTETRVVEILSPDRRVWDLGAHFGWYVLVASSSKARFVGAVEAAPTTYEHTLQTAKQAKVARVVSGALVPGASIGPSQRAPVAFYLGKGHDGALYSSLTPVGGAFETIAVQPLTIGDLVEKEGWPRPDLVKIDVEGAETWLVGELVDRFADARPDIIAEVNFEACAAAGAFPYPFLEQLLAAYDRCFVIDEQRSRLVGVTSARQVRHGDNVLAASSASASRLTELVDRS